MSTTSCSVARRRVTMSLTWSGLKSPLSRTEIFALGLAKVASLREKPTGRSLAVGTLFGAAVAGGPRYYQPAPVYVAPAPVYVAPECYWTRGAPVWDGYRGIWYRPRIQVCD